MTIEQARDLYMFCDGNEGYYMWHEAGKEAKEFHDLNIPREVKGEWDREIIEKNLQFLEKADDYAGSALHRIINAFNRENLNVTAYADRLLTIMENMTLKDPMVKIDIIRTMGEDSLNYTCGCRFFCLHTFFADRMDEMMQRLMEFEVPDEICEPRYPKSPNKQDLYKTAVSEYCRSFSKWSGRTIDTEERIRLLTDKNCKKAE